MNIIESELDSSTNSFPRVLIVGVSFNNNSGPGITLNSIFKGWDSAAIAVACENLGNIDFNICSNYYQLGYEENRRRFPFHLIQKKRKSGIFLNLNNQNSLFTNNKRFSKFLLEKFVSKTLHFFGLFHYSRRLKLSPDFQKWVDAFKPDFIYTHGNSLEIIDLVKKISLVQNCSIITHIMDDYPKDYFNPFGLGYFILKSKINHVFNDLFKNSNLCLAISEEMALEYMNRYGLKFKVLHNSLDLKFWKKSLKVEYKIGKEFVFLYAGRIGIGIDKCLLEIAKAIEFYLQDHITGDFKIIFEIQSTNEHPILQQLIRYHFVRLNEKIDFSLLPSKFQKVDVLVLPNNFDKKSIQYLKLSMPNKAPEYMISGTPILLYSSSETAICKHAIKYSWAKVVSKQSKLDLLNAIDNLVRNENMRVSLGTNARSFAEKNFDAEIIQNEFLDSIKKLMKSK